MCCRDNAIPLVTSHIPSLSMKAKKEALQVAVHHILSKGKVVGESCVSHDLNAISNPHAFQQHVRL